MFITPACSFFDGILILLSWKTIDYIIKFIFNDVIIVKFSYMLDEKMFGNPYKSTTVLIMHTKYFMSKLYVRSWTLFSVTNNSADKNIMLRPDSNQ
jgi:hypothetical protein